MPAAAGVPALCAAGTAAAVRPSVFIAATAPSLGGSARRAVSWPPAIVRPATFTAPPLALTSAVSAQSTSPARRVAAAARQAPATRPMAATSWLRCCTVASAASTLACTASISRSTRRFAPASTMARQAPAMVAISSQAADPPAAPGRSKRKTMTWSSSRPISGTVRPSAGAAASSRRGARPTA